MQIVLDFYKRVPQTTQSIEGFLHDVEIVHDYIIQDLKEKEKGATISSLHPVQ